MMIFEIQPFLQKNHKKQPFAQGYKIGTPSQIAPKGLQKRYQQKNPTQYFCTGPVYRPRTTKIGHLFRFEIFHSLQNLLSDIHKLYETHLLRVIFPLWNKDISSSPQIVHKCSIGTVFQDDVQRSILTFSGMLNLLATRTIDDFFEFFSFEKNKQG